MPARKLALRLSAATYAVFWLGGVYTRCFRPESIAPGWASPVFLLLAAATAILSGLELRVALLFACGGFAAEVIGVKTGMLFGRYTYTNVLGASLAAVPIAISCAWLALLASARDAAWRIIDKQLFAAAAGAMMMAAADLLIDPVATRILGFWRWAQPGSYFGVPLTNFVGWFVVSLVLLAFAGRPARPSSTAAWIGSTILLFFGAIAACTYASRTR